MSVEVAVVGASGRLGQIVCSVVEQMAGFHLGATLGSADSLDFAEASIVVDATTPASSEQIVQAALTTGARVLVGTSGWSSDKLQALSTALESTPDQAVMVVPNFSVGSVLATRLSVLAAEFFDSIEIVETHHQHKIDSPSGTARRTAELIAQARRDRGGVVAPHANQTARGELVDGVPVHSLRLEGVVARQDVIFGGNAETLTISHDTQSAQAYRHGIELALRSLLHQKGLVVGLDQVLGLRNQ